jgi:hypothetical protein
MGVIFGAVMGGMVHTKPPVATGRVYFLVKVARGSNWRERGLT